MVQALLDTTRLEDREGHLDSVAQAFSRKALIYDQFGANHENLARMWAKVLRHALNFLFRGDHILELNAGTGADAAFFARLGYTVHATDLSPGMVARIKARIAQENLESHLTVQQCSFDDLSPVENGPFDYVFSNMGGINCYPDPQRIVQELRRLLSPGAFVTWVVMSPFNLWEALLILRGDFKTATRRLSPKGVLANVEGVHFMTYYFSPGHIRSAFGAQFRPIRLQGLSVFTPPADRKDFPVHHPRLYRLLRALDERFSDWPPFNRWGDFYILTLQYLPGADER